MDIGNETTGFGTSSTALRSSQQTSPPERGAKPPGIGVGAPRAMTLASLPAASNTIASAHTVPCFIGDDMSAIERALKQGHFLEAASLAGIAAGASSKAIAAMLGVLNRRIAFTAPNDVASTTTTTTTTATAETASTTTITVPALSVFSASTTRMTYTVDDAFKAIANDDPVALERFLATLRRTKQDRQSQQPMPARYDGSAVRTSKLQSALLTTAACLGRSSLIPALLASGALLEHTDVDGDTALILAAKHGHTAAMKLLLQAGADTEHADAAGWTALIHAAKSGSKEVVALLLARGANMTVRNRKGALLMAVALENSDDAKLRSLSKQALKRRAGRRPSVSVAVAPSTTHQLLSRVFRAVEKKDAHLLRQLLAQISNYRINIEMELGCLRRPDASNKSLLKDGMMTPLMLAAFSGDVDSLELLLGAGADIAQSDSRGMTALMWAAGAGRTAAVDVLLDGGKVNQADVSGATALIRAVESRVAASVQALLDAGANVNHATKDGWNALMYAAKIGDTAIIKVLLRAGAKTDQARPSGKTALYYAALYGHTSSVNALIKAKVGFDQASKNGWTALMCAAAKGHDAIVDALLRAGCRTNLAGPGGMTALMYAAGRGHTVAVGSLLRAGAAIDQVNGNGASALMCAADEGRHAAVKVLLEAGANFRLAAKDVGYTAMRIATKQGHTRCIELLRAAGAN